MLRLRLADGWKGFKEVLLLTVGLFAFSLFVGSATLAVLGRLPDSVSGRTEVTIYLAVIAGVGTLVIGLSAGLWRGFQWAAREYPMKKILREGCIFGGLALVTLAAVADATWSWWRWVWENRPPLITLGVLLLAVGLRLWLPDLIQRGKDGRQ